MLKYRKSCPVCKASSYDVLIDKAYSDSVIKNYLINYYNLSDRGLHKNYDELTCDARYVLKKCNNCSAVFQSFYPDEVFSQIIYSEWIDSPATRKSDETRATFLDTKHYMSEAIKLTALALRKTGKARPSQLRVLDFGMGRGGFAMALKACGCVTYGYDFSKDRQQIGNGLGITVVGLKEIEMLDFDLINTEQVFEHLPDPLGTARTLAAALRHNGILKISVPFNRWLEKGDFVINWNASRYARNSPIPNAPLEHLQYYRRPSLDYLGRHIGLSRIRIPIADHLNYSLDWLNVRHAAKNLVRATAMERFRNYYLFVNERSQGNVGNS